MLVLCHSVLLLAWLKLAARDRRMDRWFDTVVPMFLCFHERPFQRIVINISTVSQCHGDYITLSAKYKKKEKKKNHALAASASTSRLVPSLAPASPSVLCRYSMRGEAWIMHFLPAQPLNSTTLFFRLSPETRLTLT